MRIVAHLSFNSSHGLKNKQLIVTFYLIILTFSLAILSLYLSLFFLQFWEEKVSEL